jgi:hypothetical protein
MTLRVSDYVCVILSIQWQRLLWQQTLQTGIVWVHSDVYTLQSTINPPFLVKKFLADMCKFILVTKYDTWRRKRHGGIALHILTLVTK